MNFTMFRIGADLPQQLLLLEPVFEEANRTRRTLALAMRHLEAAGIGSAIPDLPGTAESLSDIGETSFEYWREAARDAFAHLSKGAQTCLAASVRGGALVDDATGSPALWRLSPETGSRIVRDLKRAAAASASSEVGKLAGHALSADFLASLEAAIPERAPYTRIARLETEAADADVRFSGTPVWRRAEPGEDTSLAAAMAADIRQWYASCASA